MYDTKPDPMMILVTGSARLEVFMQSGDPLAGRYFAHRLLPFSPSELAEERQFGNLSIYLERGGFPEPFLANDPVDADRWRMQYLDGLIRTDILDFEKIHDFRAIHLVLELLRSSVGSPVSYKSIAEDVGIAPNTAKKYIQILESLYIVFRVTPFSKNIARSILKEPKIYFLDTGLVEGDAGAKFENLVAVSLLKYTYAMVDYKGVPFTLNYLRTKDGAEVDFCLVKRNVPERMIEVKISDDNPGKVILNFNIRYNIPGTQVVMHLRNEHIKNNIEIRNGYQFLISLDFLD